MQQGWDCIDAIPAIQKKEIFNMFTKDFFDKHFRMHNKLTLYTKDKAFANAEDAAFVNGTGVNMPTGYRLQEEVLFS